MKQINDSLTRIGIPLKHIKAYQMEENPSKEIKRMLLREEELFYLSAACDLEIMPTPTILSTPWKGSGNVEKSARFTQG